MSLHWWGVQLGDHSISGRWSAAQHYDHINIFKMEVVIIAVRGFLHKLHGKVVRLMWDNATVVAYVRQEGGTKSFRLTCLTIGLLKYCDHKGIIIIPVHIPGQCNQSVAAGPDIPDWVGDRPQFTGTSDQMMGIPMGLFVTFSNQKCQQFVSLYLDPQVAFINAMSIPWSQMGTVYAFPLFKMIATIVAKLRQLQAITMILLAPCQMDASWMPELLQLSWDIPIPIATHSTGSSSQQRSQDPDLPLLISTCVENLRALFRKLGYSECFSELMTSTLRPSSGFMRTTGNLSSLIVNRKKSMYLMSATHSSAIM